MGLRNRKDVKENVEEEEKEDEDKKVKTFIPLRKGKSKAEYVFETTGFRNT